MVITLLRCLILYITITLFMRFMGKRQLGELQPGELVITILLSEIISVPMENNEIPLLPSLFASALLVCLEIISSVINIKSPKISRLLQGNPAVIIKNGVLNQKMLKALRFSADDILEQLRQKDIFDIKEVDFAVVETNGSLSVKQKNEYRTVNCGDLKIKSKDSVPCLAVNDGTIFIKKDDINGLKTVEEILKKEKISHKDILILLIYNKNKYTLIKKE